MDVTHDLDALERSLAFLNLTGVTHPGEVELRRLYLPLANGTVAPSPVVQGLEEVVGGSLVVGWLPVRVDRKTLVNHGDWYWSLNALRLVKFKDQHGRFPKRVETDDSGFATLGEWLGRCRMDASDLSLERRALLAQAVPGWDATPDPFTMNVERLVQFHAEYGRFPTRNDNDNEGGARLGKMYSNYRPGQRITTERRAILDRELPGWDQ